MAMPNNTISVIEATPKVVKALEKLTVNQPFGNENSSTKNKGMNGGISFNTDNGENAIITGPFDVQLTYLEEDGEMVPYIHILDSSVPNATYAGDVYYQNTIKNILPGILAPSQGWLYLEIDLLNNTATYNIASVVPTYPLAMKKWAYALAYVSFSNNVYSIRRIHLPGNIIMPSLEDEYRPGDLFIIYPYTDTSVKVKSGLVYLGTTAIQVNESAIINANENKRYIYVEVEYRNETFLSSITWASSIQVPDSYNRSSFFRYTIGCIYMINGGMRIEQWHNPSPIIIYNRWVG